MREDEFYARFGSAVRYWRKKKGLTQAKLAEALGLSRASIANIERGRQKVLLYQFSELCSLFRVPPSELLSPDEIELGKAGLQDILDKVPEQYRNAVEAVLAPSQAD